MYHKKILIHMYMSYIYILYIEDIKDIECIYIYIYAYIYIYIYIYIYLISKNIRKSNVKTNIELYYFF